MTMSPRSAALASVSRTLGAVAMDALAGLADTADPLLSLAVDTATREAIADVSDADLAALAILPREALAAFAREHVVPSVRAAVIAELAEVGVVAAPATASLN